jgi:hypothetical protein
VKLLIGFLVSAILVSLNPIGIEAINFTELAMKGLLNTTKINETDSAMTEADRIIREAINKGSINGTSQGGGALQILSHNSFTDSIGYLHVVGEVQNNSPTSAQFVQVIGTFYDVNNAVVGTQFTYTNPSDIISGGKAPFDLVLTSASVPTSLIDHYELQASYQ